MKKLKGSSRRAVLPLLTILVVLAVISLDFPCAEGVQWPIFKKVRQKVKEISDEISKKIDKVTKKIPLTTPCDDTATKVTKCTDVKDKKSCLHSYQKINSYFVECNGCMWIDDHNDPKKSRCTKGYPSCYSVKLGCQKARPRPKK